MIDLDHDYELVRWLLLALIYGLRVPCVDPALFWLITRRQREQAPKPCLPSLGRHRKEAMKQIGELVFTDGVTRNVYLDTDGQQYVLDEVLPETAENGALPQFHFAIGKVSRFGMTSMNR